MESLSGPLDTDVALFDATFAFFREVSRGFRLSPDVLSPTQFHILMIIQEQGTASLMAVANQLQVAGPTATRSVEALEQRGLIFKDRDPQDRRIIWLRLTEAGQAALEREREVQTRHVVRVLARLDAAERERLGQLLEKATQGGEVFRRAQHSASGS